MAIAVLVACSGASNRCVPGAAVDCVCSSSPAPLHGAQICGADGTYRPCQCVGQTAQRPEASAAISGSATVSGPTGSTTETAGAETRVAAAAAATSPAAGSRPTPAAAGRTREQAEVEAQAETNRLIEGALDDRAAKAVLATLLGAEARSASLDGHVPAPAKSAPTSSNGKVAAPSETVLALLKTPLAEPPADSTTAAASNPVGAWKVSVKIGTAQCKGDDVKDSSIDPQRIDDVWLISAAPGGGYTVTSNLMLGTYALTKVGARWQLSAPYGGVSFGFTIDIEISGDVLRASGDWGGTSPAEDSAGNVVHVDCDAPVTVAGRRDGRGQ